jgi:hypothetical protein
MQRAASPAVANRSSAPALHRVCEESLNMLDDSLRSIALLVEAHRRQKSLSPRTLNNLQRQCEAASVGSARLREQFSRITLRAALGE